MRSSSRFGTLWLFTWAWIFVESTHLFAAVPVVQWSSPEWGEDLCGCRMILSDTFPMSIRANHPDATGRIVEIRIGRGAQPSTIVRVDPAREVQIEHRMENFPIGTFPIYVEAVDESGGVGRASVPRISRVEVSELLPESGLWRYLVTTNEPPAGWTSPDFDDSGWAQGRTPFGNAAPAQTILPGLPHSSPIYFRRVFQVPSFLPIYRNRVSVHGGAILHVNGEELRRYDLPAGNLSAATRAVAKPRTTPPAIVVDDVIQIRGDIAYPLPIRTGSNLLAVALYPAPEDGSAPWLDLSIATIDLSWDCNCPFRIRRNDARIEEGKIRIDRHTGEPLMIAPSPHGPWIQYSGPDQNDPVIYVVPTAWAMYFR